MITRKNRLRLISLVMLAVAVIFVLCALSNPTLGTAFCIGNFYIGADVWRACYAIYVVVMAALFLASFFVKDGKQTREE